MCFSVLSPSSHVNDFYGFSSPLNLNASQFVNNNKNQNFSLALENNFFNSSFMNSNFNPLSVMSPCNMNRGVFSHSNNNACNDIMFDGLVNPLAPVLTPLARINEENNNNIIAGADNNNNDKPGNQRRLPSLNIDIINKTDTCRIFRDSVLSCIDSPVSDIRKPYCLKNYDDFFDNSTKENSTSGSAQTNSKIFNATMKSPTSTTTPMQSQVNFYVSPRSCFRNCDI